MNLQGRNLSSETQGADVALLHTELRQLGLTITGAETTAQSFGPSTHAAVQLFQKQHGIAPTGVVDAQTATAINAEVNKLAGARTAAPGAVPVVVSTPSVATRPNPPPAPTAPASGPAGTPGPPALTRPSENPLAATTPPVEVKVVYAPTPGSPASTPPPTPPAAAPESTVRGQVRHADSATVSSITVQAFDQDLRSREALGIAVTDAAGRYFIRYTAAQFSRAEKKSADLVVQVLDGTGKVLVSSPVMFNAPPDAVIDLMISGGVYPGPSEYEQLVEALNPLLPPGITFADLVEDETHQDISFLAGETGQDPQRIAFLAAANRLGLKTGLPAEAFYAFFRQKLPTDLAALHGRGSGPLRSALQKSIEDNIVPLSLEGKVDEIIGRIIALPILQPVFVVAPNLLYASPANLAGLPPDQSAYIAAKLNDQLGREILTKIGAMSPAMARATHAALSRLDYRSVLDLTVSAVITTGILAEARRDPNLADEVARITSRLTNIVMATVAQVLRLDAPIQDHPAFLADVRRVTTLEYARLAQIDKAIASSLLEKLLPVWEAGDQPLADLVAQGSITQTQMAALRLTFELGRFTGNNIPFVTALRNKAIKSSVDLIGWEKSDWQQLIITEKLQPPPGETVESYADTLAFNVEQTYPAHALIQRVLKPERTGQFKLLDSLNAMLANNERLIDGPNPASINWDSLNAADQQKVQADLQSLAEFSNAYRELGVADLINDKGLELARKKDAIAARVELLSTFQNNNADLDLRFVDFFAKESNGLNWNGIPTADQPSVRKQLMAYQRVIALADVTADRQMLLSKGFDSAYTIYSKTEDDFAKTSGLPVGNARKAYADAQERSLAVSHSAEAIRSGGRGSFTKIAMSNQPPDLVNDLRQIDGFSDLFGPQNYCECDDCRSILSPAAYFADLMNFIEQNISKAAFVDKKLTDHPLYLISEKPAPGFVDASFDL
jgi:peptidoglycan hydrolase-like protein with peptidoglycan-binding domain